MYILNPQLYIRNPPVIILHDGIADIDRISVPDMLEMLSLVEGDGGYVAVRLGLLDEFELEMPCIGPYATAVAVVVDVFREENGGGIARAERLELL